MQVGARNIKISRIFNRNMNFRAFFWCLRKFSKIIWINNFNWSPHLTDADSYNTLLKQHCWERVLISGDWYQTGRDHKNISWSHNFFLNLRILLLGKRMSEKNSARKCFSSGQSLTSRGILTNRRGSKNWHNALYPISLRNIIVRMLLTAYVTLIFIFMNISQSFRSIVLLLHTLTTNHWAA